MTRRRWSRYSLRSMLLLVLFAAVFLAGRASRQVEFGRMEAGYNRLHRSYLQARDRERVQKREIRQHGIIVQLQEVDPRQTREPLDDPQVMCSLPPNPSDTSAQGTE